jgi:hypothetical protein
MEHLLRLTIESQPTDSTCGPTCLQAVYAYWKDAISLPQVISEIGELPNGGTMAVHLACHALRRGYSATIYTYNLFLFDPTWFIGPEPDLATKLRRQSELKESSNPRISEATSSYLEFLELGGKLRMEPLEEALLIRSLTAEVPVLSGLSATFLYQESRERAFPPDANGVSSEPDDVGGEPVGHFVVLSGYNSATGEVMVNDPQVENPFANHRQYAAPMAKVSAAILLGIASYDANLLMIQPSTKR